jgi:hypothetical protein
MEESGGIRDATCSRELAPAVVLRLADALPWISAHSRGGARTATPACLQDAGERP